MTDRTTTAGQPIFTITDIDDIRVAPYVSLTEAQLRNRLDTSDAIFIAESPKVIHAALDMGLVPESLLCEEKHLAGDARAVLERCPDSMPVYTGAREVLERLTGYRLTRGVLCAIPRPRPLSVKDICTPDASRVVVIDGVCDTTNIGSIFRAAAALGIDGVLLTPTSCDPLNRRSVRVSMGTVFRLPWAWIEDIGEVHRYGFETVAMALTDNSVPIDDPTLASRPRLAIIMGTEGDGLSDSVIGDADFVARIPMQRGVDSLNVASAAALAFWQLRKI